MKRIEKKEVVRRVVDPYLTAKKDRTMSGIYKRIRPGPDGKSRTVLSASGTETGRLNSSESLVDQSTNWQNIPNITALEDDLYRVRDCVIASPGMTLLAVDFDKAEAVAAAAYMKDWEFYERLIAGEDVHSWHAGHFFGVEEWKHGVKAPKVQYQISKNATYASNYMAGIPTIQSTVNKKWEMIGRRVSRTEVEDMSRIYKGLHPLREWWGSVGAELRRKGYLVNAFGFKRMFYNPDSHGRLKEALAFLPQSTVASNINRALIKVYNDLDSPGEIECLLQVHDELLFQVRSDLVEDAYYQIVQIMERPFAVHGREVYIPASGKVGDCWGMMTEMQTTA